MPVAGVSPRFARRLVLAGLMVGTAALLDAPRNSRPGHQAELVPAGETRVRTLTAGSGDTTLVLLHGYGEHLLTWRSVVDPLARRYRVVALDLPGFGASDKPDREYSLEFLAAEVGAFLSRWAQPPTVLVGHSMGGAIATRLAVTRPDLVHGLILIAPAGLRIGLGPIADDPTPARAASIGAWEAARAFVTPLHDPDWLREPAELAGYDPTTDPAFRRAAARALLEFDFEGIGEDFARIPQPTLLIWGSADPVIPIEVGEEVAAMLPCRRWEVLRRTLHRPQVERPDTVVSLVLDFLADPSCESPGRDWPVLRQP